MEQVLTDLPNLLTINGLLHISPNPMNFSGKESFPMDLQETVQRLDKSDMLSKIRLMPEHFKQAMAANEDVVIPYSSSDIAKIVIAGMGGSAISGDVIRCLAGATATVPVFVNRNYDLPAWVGADTLVIVSSYSGNTEESLAAYEQAQQAGARMICITSGGRLGEDARSKGYPVFALPPGYPPRTALVFLTVPLLKIFHALGYIGEFSAAVEETCSVIEGFWSTYSPESDPKHNVPLLVARQCEGLMPVIYSCSGLLEVAGVRWRGQFSENAEVLAFSNTFPEMNHNEIVGWGLHPELDKAMQVIYLRDRADNERNQKRMDIVREIIETTSNPVLEIWSSGESSLARLFSTIFIGDLASYYAALVNGVDPTPVDTIDYLKKSLAGTKG